MRQVISPLGGYVAIAQSPRAIDIDREMVIRRNGPRPFDVLHFPYSRQVEVVWAPDETAVAVVDAMAPTENRIVIYALPSGRQLFELRRDDICQIDKRLPCGRDYQRVYFNNVIWMAPDQIQVALEMFQPNSENLPPEIHVPFSVNFGKNESPR